MDFRDLLHDHVALDNLISISLVLGIILLLSLWVLAYYKVLSYALYTLPFLGLVAVGGYLARTSPEAGCTVMVLGFTALGFCFRRPTDWDAPQVRLRVNKTVDYEEDDDDDDDELIDRAEVKEIVRKAIDEAADEVLDETKGHKRYKAPTDVAAAGDYPHAP
jgi:hypothetical protein